jgi:aspartate carbamoyltransferase catalytic subunit
LTGINDLSSDAILSILEKSRFYSQNIKTPENYEKVLKDTLVANIFFENSTRTRFSFEVAQKRLGAMVLNFDKSSSSVAKGETLYDTLKTFESLGVDIAVIRHSDDQFVADLKDSVKFSIVNAGAGKFEHPSQSLLDLFTIQEEFGSFDGLTVTICGDIASSRVAKSNINAFKKLGVKVNLCGPEMLLPNENDLPANCRIKPLDEAVAESDAVMLLRIQHERHETFELATESYNQQYGLNHQRLELFKEKAIIMHPGPVNRDVEILSELVEHERSRIFKQMENGVYTRMAILDWLKN